MYTIKNLLKTIKETEVYIDGNWYAARPLTFDRISLLRRIHNAYYVLTGKADAIIWPEDEIKEKQKYK